MEVCSPFPDVMKTIRKLDKHMSAKVMGILYFLEVHGSLLGMPDSKMIERNLFELRITKPIHVRLMYMFYEERAIILSIFLKKSEKIPQYELKLARTRKRSIEGR